MIGNTRYGQMSHLSRCYPRHAGFMFGYHPRKLIILNAWFQLWNMEPDLDDLGSNIQYSAGPVLTLNGRITASDYVDILGSQVHPVVQVLFRKNDAVFQEDDLPVHTARSVLSWFEEHEDALQHLLWLAQSPDLNIIEPLVSFREQGEKQIPSIISQATRRVVQYSTRDYSEIT